MKKRRTLIITALLIAALALGIGYAALSRELVIGSEANLAPDENDFDIVFTEAKILDEYAAVGSASLTGDPNTLPTSGAFRRSLQLLQNTINEQWDGQKEKTQGLIVKMNNERQEIERKYN